MAVLTQQFEDIGVRVRPISAPSATMLQELADRRYVDWNALPNGTLASSTVIDRFTGAGRTASVSLAVSW